MNCSKFCLFSVILCYDFSNEVIHTRIFIVLYQDILLNIYDR